LLGAAVEGDGGMSFAKLDSGIVDSTLWMQPHDVLRVWIAMMAKADATGYVRASVPSMAHLCMVPIERLEQVLAILTSPDPYSRTPDDDGRRLRAVEGGWQLVNYLAYRNARDVDAERLRKREWDREHRSSGHARSKQSDSPTQSDAVRRNPTSPTHAEAEAEVEAEKPKQEQASPRGSRLPAGSTLPADWLEWARGERPELDVNLEAAKFADYWHSQAGAKGRKADWKATWRNWIRNSHAPRAGPAGGQQVGKTMQGIMALEGLKRGNRMAAGPDRRGDAEALLPGSGKDSGG
jgi:hypothetical protein